MVESCVLVQVWKCGSLGNTKGKKFAVGILRTVQKMFDPKNFLLGNKNVIIAVVKIVLADETVAPEFDNGPMIFSHNSFLCIV
jgi:hypothetical protein